MRIGSTWPNVKSKKQNNNSAYKIMQKFCRSWRAHHNEEGEWALITPICEQIFKVKNGQLFPECKSGLYKPYGCGEQVWVLIGKMREHDNKLVANNVNYILMFLRSVLMQSVTTRVCHEYYII